MSHSVHTDADGNNLPSVSQIPGIFAHDLSGFESWICKGLHEAEAKCCIRARNDYYDESAKLGHDIHELREAFLRGKPFVDGVPEYQARVFDPIARFYKESGYQPIYIEEKLTGKDFGGTLDGCGKFSVPFWENQRKSFFDKVSLKQMMFNEVCPMIGDIWIEDLKIKSKLDPLHPLQLYGYRELLKEVCDITADWGLIIRREKKLDKTPELQLKAYYLPAYAEAWKSSMYMWRFLNE